ncbi:uncharacterized protein LOC142831131 isoform X2 [Pelodiscus sinensis]|uniref:uncharacterized protein LOC142831131 isoform X2 n=1 Tax=Pelodiscus sinensis TaxID=13735 RepID=UPI003F6C4087
MKLEKSLLSLWVKIRGESNKSDVLAGVCRSPDREGEVDQAIFGQLTDVSRSQALVLLGSFSRPDLLQSNQAVHRQSRMSCLQESGLTRQDWLPERDVAQLCAGTDGNVHDTCVFPAVRLQCLHRGGEPSQEQRLDIETRMQPNSAPFRTDPGATHAVEIS